MRRLISAAVAVAFAFGAAVIDTAGQATLTIRNAAKVTVVNNCDWRQSVEMTITGGGMAGGGAGTTTNISVGGKKSKNEDVKPAAKATTEYDRWQVTLKHAETTRGKRKCLKNEDTTILKLAKTNTANVFDLIWGTGNTTLTFTLEQQEDSQQTQSSAQAGGQPNVPTIPGFRTDPIGPGPNDPAGIGALESRVIDADVLNVGNTSPFSSLFQTMGVEGADIDADPDVTVAVPGVGDSRTPVTAFIAMLFRPAAITSARDFARDSSRSRAARRLARRDDLVDLDALLAQGRDRAVRDLVVAIVATGVTSGQAFELQVSNRSGVKRRLRAPDGLVLQPLKEELKNLAGTAAQSVARKYPLAGYCLEFAKLPPKPGTLFRIADQALQDRFKPVGRILRVTRELAESGGLHPDTEVGAYLTSIKQFAVWTKLEGWTEQQFARSFVQKTKETIEAMRRPWTREIEETVKNAIPGRWRDIVAVLKEAGG